VATEKVKGTCKVSDFCLIYVRINEYNLQIAHILGKLQYINYQNESNFEVPLKNGDFFSGYFRGWGLPLNSQFAFLPFQWNLK
jgi:hypothetical protein